MTCTTFIPKQFPSPVLGIRHPPTILRVQNRIKDGVQFEIVIGFQEQIVFNSESNLQEICVQETTSNKRVVSSRHWGFSRKCNNGHIHISNK